MDQGEQLYHENSYPRLLNMEREDLLRCSADPYENDGWMLGTHLALRARAASRRGLFQICGYGGLCALAQGLREEAHCFKQSAP